VTYSAGEVVNPRRVLPRAILCGTLAAAALYLLANAAYLYMLAPAEMAGATRVAADALGRAFGGAGGKALALLVVVSSLGVLNGSILTGVRVPYAMAIRGMLFAPLGRLHSRTFSPVNALVAQGFFACLIVVLLDKFENIASLFVDTTWLFYAVSFAGLLWIQWRERRARRGGGAGNEGVSHGFPFSTPAAAIFIVVTLAIIGSDLVKGDWHVRCGMVVVAAGIPMYHVWRRLRAAPARG
jgi:APA family basic amino acid/polyamine antiporter